MNEELNRILREFSDEVRPLEELQEELAGIRGQGQAADGLVRASALPTGALTGLKLDPRAMRLSAAALAAAVLEAAALAAADAGAKVSERMAEAMAPYVEESGRFIEGLS